VDFQSVRSNIDEIDRLSKQQYHDHMNSLKNEEYEGAGNHYILSKDSKNRMVTDTETEDMSMSIQQLQDLNLKSASKEVSLSNHIVSPKHSKKVTKLTKVSSESEDI
jgi:hypothetical protein